MNFSDVRTYVKGLLTKSFANKTVLDKLSEDDNGKINYNNSPIQDSYSKEEFDEILKSDYKQIFDKDSNVELLDAPISFTGTKASTAGTAVITNINQSFMLSQSILNFDYLIIQCHTEYNNYIYNSHSIILSVKDIVFNNSEIDNGNNKSGIDGISLDLSTGKASAYGKYHISFYSWFKTSTEIFICTIVNPFIHDVTIIIDSIVGTKFNYIKKQVY